MELKEGVGRKKDNSQKATLFTMAVYVLIPKKNMRISAYLDGLWLMIGYLVKASWKVHHFSWHRTNETQLIKWNIKSNLEFFPT